MDFKTIRKVSSYLFIVAIVVFAFVGILSVWDVFSHDILIKSFLTISLLSVGYVLIVVTTLERENRLLFGGQISQTSPEKETKTSIGKIILYLFILWMLFNMLSGLVLILSRLQ